MTLNYKTNKQNKYFFYIFEVLNWRKDPTCVQFRVALHELVREDVVGQQGELEVVRSQRSQTLLKFDSQSEESVELIKTIGQHCKFSPLRCKRNSILFVLLFSFLVKLFKADF